MADLYQYPRQGWWKVKQSYARTLTVEQLRYARTDCIETLFKGLTDNHPKYLDECSIYVLELKRRKAL